jgi:HEAT repeat protein
MGAMEAIEAGRFKSALPQVSTIAGADPSPALQIYAMQVLAKFGNPSGDQLLLSRINDTDWPARAMAFWYLGRYGSSDDYTQVQSRLVVEENPFVKSEIALACLRLAPLE